MYLMGKFGFRFMFAIRPFVHSKPDVFSPNSG